ncbi:hypothetical protein [Salinicoccus sp. HZC-1]|uniref:hypothetical protein n=1 Tax=Salinicoccus sp. HZC-1 TaxID=3385497 RepID=UPI00398B39A2
MNEKIGQTIYWILFIVGALSFAISFSVEYGIVYTMVMTSICGVMDLLLASILRRKELIILSVLLVASPYIMFLVIYFI